MDKLCKQLKIKTKLLHRSVWIVKGVELFLRLVLVLATPLAFLDKLLSWTGDNLLILEGGESCERVLWNLRLVSRRQHLSSFSILVSFLPNRKRTWKVKIHLVKVSYCKHFMVHTSKTLKMYYITLQNLLNFSLLSRKIQRRNIYYSESSSKVVYCLA